MSSNSAPERDLIFIWKDWHQDFALRDRLKLTQRWPVSYRLSFGGLISHRIPVTQWFKLLLIHIFFASGTSSTESTDVHHGGIPTTDKTGNQSTQSMHELYVATPRRVIQWLNACANRKCKQVKKDLASCTLTSPAIRSLGDSAAHIFRSVDLERVCLYLYHNVHGLFQIVHVWSLQNATPTPFPFNPLLLRQVLSLTFALFISR